MKLNIVNIINSFGASLDFEGEFNAERITGFPSPFIFYKPLRIKGTVANINGSLELKAHAEGDYFTDCNRCNEEASFRFEADIIEKLSKEPLGDEFELIVQNEVNIDEIIEKNFLSNMPYLHLCNEDCKGLCPVCGQNLNEKDCGCPKESADPRLSVLDELFKDNK